MNPFGTLDRYVARRFLGIYGICLLGFVLLFLVIDGVSRIDDFMEAREELPEKVSVLALALDGVEDVLAFSAGTDGTDGPTDAAGAWASGRTAEQARARGLSPRAFLARNDSYNFFAQTGGLVMTGPTGTNVMDVRLMLAGTPR